MIARGGSIQAYANLEQSLCMLFCFLLQTTPQLGGIIFFKLNNARNRNTIIIDLTKKRGFTEHLQFVKDMISFIRPLDQTRNEIVHWTTSININTDEQGYTSQAMLVPPNIWSMSQASKIEFYDMAIFASKCDFISRLMTMFYMHIAKVSQLAEPWPKIFLSPIVYPPPSDHPLAPTPIEPEPQPQS